MGINWIDNYGILAEQFDNPVSGNSIVGRVEHDWQIANTEMWGAATMGYNFRLLKNFSIGVQAVYATNKQHVMETPFSINNRYWAVMPDVKWTWMRLGVVSLYSRAGVGVVFTKAEVKWHVNKIVNGENPWRLSTRVSESGIELESLYKMDGTRTQFTFQLSPVGIEVGGRLGPMPRAAWASPVRLS